MALAENIHQQAFSRNQAFLTVPLCAAYTAASRGPAICPSQREKEKKRSFDDHCNLFYDFVPQLDAATVDVGRLGSGSVWPGLSWMKMHY